MSELQTRSDLSASNWQQNPVLLHLLGLSPLLAVSTELGLALALTIANTVVILLSSLATIRIPATLRGNWRFFWCLLVMALFTSLLDWTLQRYQAALHAGLGIYLPLICCNFALTLYLTKPPGEEKLPERFGRLTRLLITYSAVFLILATLRELLSYGSVLHNFQALLSNQEDAITAATPDGIGRFINSPAGALIGLGLLAAAYNGLKLLFPSLENNNALVSPAERARVTEKLNS